MLQHIILLITSLLPLNQFDLPNLYTQAFTSQADSECRNAVNGNLIYQCGTSDLYAPCDTGFSAACANLGGIVSSCSGTCADMGNLVCDDNNRLYADCVDFETECENDGYNYLPVTPTNGTCVEDPQDGQHFCCGSVDSDGGAAGQGSGENCAATSGSIEVINTCQHSLNCPAGWTKTDGNVECI